MSHHSVYPRAVEYVTGTARSAASTSSETHTRFASVFMESILIAAQLWADHLQIGDNNEMQLQILRLRLRMTNQISGQIRLYPALFTLTTVIFSKPSSKSGGFSFSAILRITSSLTERSRWRLRSRHTSSGTSKKTACTS